MFPIPSPLPTNIHPRRLEGRLYQAPKIATLAPHVMAGLDPAIGYPRQFANDAIPVSNHPMEMAGLILGSSPRTAMTGLHAARQQSGPLELPTEIVSLSFVPSHCRTLQVGSSRSHCATIRTLDYECAALDNLRPVPAERARLQYRDKRLLLHIFSPCAPASNVSHSAIHGQWRGSPHVRSAINMQDLAGYRVGVLRSKEHCGSRNLIRR
jgi:hypothetical protein